MPFPVIFIGIALLAVLVIFPAIIFNITLFKFLTNPLLYWILVIGLAAFILHKLGFLKKLMGMVRL